MVESEIFSQLVIDGLDPDNVSQSVIEDEMNLFMSFTQQRNALERGE